MSTNYRVSIQISQAQKRIVIHDLDHKHKSIAVTGTHMQKLISNIKHVAKLSPNLNIADGLAMATSEFTEQLWGTA